MAESGLHLHRIVLRDPLGLHRRAREMRLPDHPHDPDYVLHSVLNELAGPEYMRTFVTDPRSRGNAILVYSYLDREGLLEQAQVVAPPEVFALVDWESSQSKPLPKTWPVGKKIGFRVRVSPVVRGPRSHGKNGIETRKQRPEVDVYLARCWQQVEAPDREEVYREWLGRELARGGAVESAEMRMVGFGLRRFLRRDGNRKARGLTRPDALFKGTLRIADSDAFQALLARGIGRHRGFGFGMLLLTAESD